MSIGNTRRWVSMALCEQNYTQSGILAVQLEQMRMGSSGRFTEQPSKIVAFDDDVEFCVAAEPVRYHQGKTFKRASALLAEPDFQTSHWRRALLALSDDEQAWLRFCYGDTYYRSDLNHVVTRIMRSFVQRHNESGLKVMRSKTADILISGIPYLICGIRRNILFGEMDAYDEDKYVSFLAGIPIKSWRKDYRPRWTLMKKTCVDLDINSLLNIARMRSDIINCNRGYSPALSVQTGYAQSSSQASA